MERAHSRSPCGKLQEQGCVPRGQDTRTQQAGADTPCIVDIEVIPVAGRDSLLLSLAGARGPFFTRNLVVMWDSAGRTGLGEVPSGEGIRQTLERARPLIMGRRIGLCNAIPGDIRRMLAAVGEAGPASRIHQVTSAAEAAILRRTHEVNLCTDNVITAVEAALLDRSGQLPGVPVTALLGSGLQRDAVPMLACLFYIGDRTRTDLPSPSDPKARSGWECLRDQAALTPEAIVRCAEAAVARYAFSDFKLKVV